MLEIGRSMEFPSGHLLNSVAWVSTTKYLRKQLRHLAVGETLYDVWHPFIATALRLQLQVLLVTFGWARHPALPCIVMKALTSRRQFCLTCWRKHVTWFSSSYGIHPTPQCSTLVSSSCGTLLLSPCLGCPLVITSCLNHESIQEWVSALHSQCSWPDPFDERLHALVLSRCQQLCASATLQDRTDARNKAVAEQEVVCVRENWASSKGMPPDLLPRHSSKQHQQVGTLWCGAYKDGQGLVVLPTDLTCGASPHCAPCTKPALQIWRQASG